MTQEKNPDCPACGERNAIAEPNTYEILDIIISRLLYQLNLEKPEYRAALRKSWGIPE